MDHLSPSDAAAVASAGRRLLRAHQITNHQHSLLTVLLWGGLRRHGRATLEASLTRLQDRAAMTRETVTGGIRRLAELGLVAITKRRVRIAWGPAVASRQATSRYQLLVPSTESGKPTVPQELEILIVKGSPAQREAAAALTAVRRRRAAERWAGQLQRQRSLVVT